MLSWIRRVRTRLLGEPAVFEFWDGSGSRRIDPVQTLRRLQAALPYDFKSHPAFATADDPEVLAFTCQVVRRVFDVRPFDAEEHRGLTVTETLDLLREFLAFCANANG